jgi:hypothetical protein
LLRPLESGVFGQALIINLAEIWEKGKSSNDVVVQAGDIVFVPKKNIGF